MGAWRCRGEGQGEVRSDSQFSGLNSWMEEGAEEGNMEKEQVWGEEDGDSSSVLFLVIGLLFKRALQLCGRWKPFRAREMLAQLGMFWCFLAMIFPSNCVLLAEPLGGRTVAVPRPIIF